MHRLTEYSGKKTVYGGRRAPAALLAALILALTLAGCGLADWEPDMGELLTPAAEVTDFGAQKADGYGAEAPQDGETAGMLTLPAVDYTDPYAWEYCYQQLDEPRQQWYRDIQGILAGMEQEQALSAQGLEAGLDEEDIEQIFCYVLADHPEYFYVDGYRYTKYSRLDRLIKIEFSGSYIYDSRECEERQRLIQERAQELLERAPGGEDDYERARYVYETLIRNTDYVLDAPDSQNLYSVLVSGASVCQGYAKATQYLLNHLGIPCVLVQGQVEPGEGHAWNLLCLDGEYYYMDTTWGDASYRQEAAGAEEEEWIPQVNYDYLCVTTEQLLRTHTPDGEVPLPECTATRDNYYVREGCLLSACEETAIRQAFDRAARMGRQEISLKCTQEEVYRQVLEYLVGQKEVFSYLEEGYDTLHYARNERQLSVTFWFAR